MVVYARNALTFMRILFADVSAAADRTIKSGYRFRYIVDFMFAFCYIQCVPFVLRCKCLSLHLIISRLQLAVRINPVSVTEKFLICTQSACAVQRISRRRRRRSTLPRSGTTAANQRKK